MRTGHLATMTKVAVVAIALVVAGCSSSTGNDGADGADLCAQAEQRCPAIFKGATCTSSAACQVGCLLESDCALDARFTSCVAARCTTGPVGTVDAGIDTGSRPADPADTGSGTSSKDSGSTGSDTSSSGGRGCSADDKYSCTCAAGVTDDGKGCGASSLASPGVCCSNDSRCRCQSVTCTSNSGGCACMVSGVASSSTSCTGPLCCAFAASSSSGGVGYCACYTKPGTGGCAALGGTTVSSCSASNVPCYYKGDHTVSTCH
jgi:hypothetical protein